MVARTRSRKRSRPARLRGYGYTNILVRELPPEGGRTGQFTHKTAQADRGARLGPRDDGTSNLENPRRRAAENHVALLRREPQRLDDLDRPIKPNVEAIVAAGNHPMDDYL